MPLSLKAPSALRAPLQRISLVRPFSSTSAVLNPRDVARHDAAAAAHASPSTSPTSTSRLAGLINKPPTAARAWQPREQQHAKQGQDGSSQPQAPRGGISAKILSKFQDRHEANARNRVAQLEMLRNQQLSKQYLRQMPRSWDLGDVYSPRDLGPVEMAKWRRRSPRKADVVNALGIRPLDMYKNFSLIQDFTSPTAAIQPRKVTQLSPVNQRKMAKMIRRAQGMGIYPTIHDHPELIRNEFYPERNGK